MGFEPILGQERAKRVLLRAIETGRVVQAYLFLGPQGVGKTFTAKVFAMNLMVKGCKGCGTCKECLSILGERHPDLLLIRPEGKELGIEQIRQLRQEVTYPPFRSKKRFVIIERAESMTREASNAFLKTLEEPNPENLFILESQGKELILPTIYSRCQRVLFSPLSHGHVADILERQRGLSRDRALILSQVAGGSLRRCAEILEGGYLEERGNLYYSHMEGLKKGPGEMIQMVFDLAQDLEKRQMDPSKFLWMLECWYRDVLASKGGVDTGMLYNPDFSMKLKEIARDQEKEALLDAILKIERARQDLSTGTNNYLVLEDLFLSLKEVLKS